MAWFTDWSGELPNTSEVESCRRLALEALVRLSQADSQIPSAIFSTNSTLILNQLGSPTILRAKCTATYEDGTPWPLYSLFTITRGNQLYVHQLGATSDYVLYTGSIPNTFPADLVAGISGTQLTLVAELDPGDRERMELPVEKWYEHLLISRSAVCEEISVMSGGVFRPAAIHLVEQNRRRFGVNLPLPQVA